MTAPSPDSLPRASLAEFTGTGLLIVAVVGSGSMAENLTDDAALRLLANAGATVGALYALILMFGPLSGAHFNPLVTLLATMRGEASRARLAAYVVAQVAGGCAGSAVANLMFDRAPWQWSTKLREGAGVWLGEVVATAGLLLVVVLVGRARSVAVPAAVAAWIGGAYWFTSSTSLANPAVTVARSLSESFAGIAPRSVPMFILMQLVGVAVATALLRALGAWRRT